jgi:hypothetical protein
MLQCGARVGLVAIVLGVALTGAGCAGATPEAVMVKADGEIASLSYALRLTPGDGTMTKMTGDAARNALIAAGFRLEKEADADVILELSLSDIEQKSFIVMTVNGKQQTKRAVTAVMRAVSSDGKTIDQHMAKFTVTQDEEVDEKKLAALTNHFAKSTELERYSLERQIERVKGGGDPEDDRGDSTAKKPKAAGKGQKANEGAEPAGEGKLPRDAIQKVERSHNAGIRLCYERALAEDSTLYGMVEVGFTVELDGMVSSTTTGPKTDLPDPSVVACVKKVFQKMEFPMPEGGVVKVSYPIEFKP